ncbi:MAG: 3-dehydroquinate synthase [Lachnospiraceae bacterium]|nr:3-dehydroquinate synthase [Lachnospiraceae bacterium]
MENDLTIKYNQSGSYDVVIRDDLSELGSHIGGLFPALKRIFIATDSNVAPLYLEDARKSVGPYCEKVICHIIEAGEEHKNLTEISACYDKLMEADFNRSDLIMGLGGGVVGDMAAFVASTYMRGCRFVNVPTTLLAMADSAVGGKCGVNYDRYKNMIGSIYMPSLVYEAAGVTKSLPDREYSSGMAEIIKAALIKDGMFYEWLISEFPLIMDRDEGMIKEMLCKAVGIKQYFVTKDPYEAKERMMLNLGHTIGHALEKHFCFRYSHGECVALGTVAAAYISYKRSYLTTEEFYEIRDMFVPFGLPISLDRFDTEDVCSNIAHDKKNTGSSLKFILLKKIGKAFICDDVTKEEIVEAIENLIVEL